MLIGYYLTIHVQIGVPVQSVPVQGVAFRGHPGMARSVHNIKISTNLALNECPKSIVKEASPLTLNRQTAAAPPNQGKRYLPSISCTWKRRNAPQKIVKP